MGNASLDRWRLGFELVFPQLGSDVFGVVPTDFWLTPAGLGVFGVQMARKLTPQFLASIQAKAGRPTTVVYDGGGLSARYGARGVVEWTVAYRIRGDRHQYRQKLGHYPDMMLEAARVAAAVIKARAAAGDHTLLEGYWTATGPLPPADMVNAVLGRYAKEELSRLKTGRAYEQLLRVAIPLDKRIGEVTRQDIRRVLDKHMKAGHGFMANRCHQALGTFFRWCVDRDLVALSPLVGMARPMRREPSRDRVLNDAELGQIWHAAGLLTCDRRDAIRFLMITGLRRGEVVKLLWSDIAGDTLTIRDPKNSMVHVVPLSPAALDLLNGRARAVEENQEVTPNFDTIVTGRVFGAKLGNLSNYGAVLRERLPDIPNFRLHDFRRSFASGCQRLGVEPVVIDKCLGHSNVIKGIAAIYLREAYMPERKAAMLLWGEHVAKIVDPR